MSRIEEFQFAARRRLNVPYHVITPDDWRSAPVVKVPIAELAASQKHLDPRVVAKHRENPGQASEYGDVYPWVDLSKRGMTIADGHHRVAEAAERGETHIHVRLLNTKKLHEEKKVRALEGIEEFNRQYREQHGQ